MKLRTLIEGTGQYQVQGDLAGEVSAITFDSREAKAGTLFVAIPGTKVDGHRFIQSAIGAGSSIIACEKIPEKTAEDVCYIQYPDTRKALALLAANFYGNPSRELNLVGITGTNGKTTIATLLYKVNSGLGFKTGILTTIEVLIAGASYPATHTTPDPLQVNRWLRQMVDEGCQYCFMEVSSHAVAQSRVEGLHFQGGIFSNITHDHLDYHPDFRAYLEAKKGFFNLLPSDAFALTNKDDRNGMVMVQQTRARVNTYSASRMADFRCRLVEHHFDGMELRLNEKGVWVRLTGKFNALNIAAVYGTCLLLGQQEDEVLEQLSLATTAEGRFEIYNAPSGRIGIVDYAHTDDALKNVLETIREINSDNRMVISVAGAGGDRDRSKRPRMGEVLARLSDRVVLTSDNPRSEDPDSILADIIKGVNPADQGKVLKISDREEAIKTACMLGDEQSIVLVAGKGHEKYQEIGGERKHFDDKELIIKYLK